jgi:hypothetical protein
VNKVGVFSALLILGLAGAAWQLGVLVAVMAAMMWLAWRYLHRWPLPTSWPWVMGYALAIVVIAEIIYLGSKAIDDQVPIHFEVLLPAFVLGRVMKRPAGADPHVDDTRPGHQEGTATATEQRVAALVSVVSTSPIARRAYA